MREKQARNDLLIAIIWGGRASHEQHAGVTIAARHFFGFVGRQDEPRTKEIV